MGARGDALGVCCWAVGVLGVNTPRERKEPKHVINEKATGDRPL